MFHQPTPLTDIKCVTTMEQRPMSTRICFIQRSIGGAGTDTQMQALNYCLLRQVPRQVVTSINYNVGTAQTCHRNANPIVLDQNVMLISSDYSDSSCTVDAACNCRHNLYRLPTAHSG